MTSTSVASAKAIKSQDGQWLVKYRTTAPGASLWDKVARENFHQVIGIDFNGVVVSAPIMQPAQSSFSSFKGQGEIGGSLTRAEATNLARALGAQRG
jgi:preprotein translocase subunit SecD